MDKNNPIKGKILIVDDDPGVAELIRDFFREHGYHSDIAKDGIQAQKLWENESYQLIVTDVVFFQSGGIDLISIIRQKDKTTPIVVMTGYGPDVAKEAMAAGANEFLLKPFGIIQMKRKLGRFLDIDRMEKRFGIIAVEKGFITTEQLFEALRIQVREDIERGEHRLIGRIFLDQGLMTFSQIDEVLESLFDIRFRNSSF
jgi:DNA-binding NtrC family response regulator